MLAQQRFRIWTDGEVRAILASWRLIFGPMGGSLLQLVSCFFVLSGYFMGGLLFIKQVSSATFCAALQSCGADVCAVYPGHGGIRCEVAACAL